MKKYKLLPEHEARFGEWRDKWIANAMSTKPMDGEEPGIPSGPPDGTLSQRI